MQIPPENRTTYEQMKAEVLQKQVDPDGGVVAFLEIPGTTIKDVVVHYDMEKYIAYYQANGEGYSDRKDIYGNYRFEGCIRMDYENNLGSGSISDLPQNVIIYGNHLGNPQGVSNDPDGIMSAPLLHFRDEEFAAKTPYIYLTTDKADLIYQIFSIADLPLITNSIEFNWVSYSDEDFLTLIADLRERSYFDYPEVSVGTGDKILSLVTSVYDYGSHNENSEQRFTIFSKLVTDNQFKETANVTVNVDRKLPPYDPNANNAE